MARSNRHGHSRPGSRSSPKPCMNCGHEKAVHVKRKFGCKVCDCERYVRRYKQE
jgi:hypothetical protein